MRATFLAGGGSARRASARSSVVMIAGLAFLAALGAPILDRYHTDLATTLLIWLALAQSWNILAGFGGQVSLGTSAFVGTGAYATGLLMIHRGVGPLPAVLAGSAAATVLALVLSIPLLRLRGDYFAIGTLAAALALQAWIVNWSFAGGSTGITLPVDRTPDATELLRLAIVVAATTLIAALIVQRSDFGLRLMAVRDNELAASGLGVSAFKHRLAALVLSSMLTGLVGSIIALREVAFEPQGMLGISWTLTALLMTIVGGIGTFMGPTIGAVVVYYLLTKQLEGFQTLSLVIEGLLLIAVVRFAPKGLSPLLGQLGRRVRGALVPATPGDDDPPERSSLLSTIRDRRHRRSRRRPGSSG